MKIDRPSRNKVVWHMTEPEFRQVCICISRQFGNISVDFVLAVNKALMESKKSSKRPVASKLRKRKKARGKK